MANTRDNTLLPPFGGSLRKDYWFLITFSVVTRSTTAIEYVDTCKDFNDITNPIVNIAVYIVGKLATVSNIDTGLYCF